jgi:hypothetical protein
VTSKKQGYTNKANSRRSTGPKTDQGKERSRQNSCKHGLTARAVLIAGEDPTHFEQLLASLEKDFEPGSGIERELVTRIAGYFWRLRRIPSFEVALLETLRSEFLPNADPKPARDPSRLAYLASFAPKSKRAVQGVANEVGDASPQLTATSEIVQAIEPSPEDLLKSLGRALTSDFRENDTLGKLSRYEAALLNAVDRTLRQLLLIQSARMANEASQVVTSAVSKSARSKK